TCAVGTDYNGANQGVWCAGRDTSKQLGDGLTTNRTLPVRALTPAGVGFHEVSAGDTHTCALARTGAVYCWGLNTSGQLGGTPNANAMATPITGAALDVQVAANASFALMT